MLEHLAAAGRTFSEGVLHLLFPKVCWVCQRSLVPDQHQFCVECRQGLTHDPALTCPRCASTVGPYTDVEKGCVHCRDASFGFDRALRLGTYEGMLREVVLRLKHHSGEGLAEVVGMLWAEHAEARLREFAADVVIPVPLHWWRRLTRGYNQSETLARAVAGRLRLPCRPLWLRRTRSTPRQTYQASAAARRENVRGAFAVRRWADFHDKTILLIDDVLTTGSTCSEAARALRKAGAARVAVAVLAHDHGGSTVTSDCKAH